MKKIYKKKDEGSMGIGALIIFIALVLVAAIAAAVIIQTTNKVRDDATHTSDRISGQFLGLFNVISVYGDRSQGGTVYSANVEKLVITTKVVSTTDFDLRHIAISIKTSDSVSRLLLSPNIQTTDDNYDAALARASATTYGVYLPNPGSSPWDPTNGSYNVAPNDLVVFVVNLTSTGQSIPVHTQFIVYFINTYTGTTGKITMTTPAGYQNDERWVKIYPPE